MILPPPDQDPLADLAYTYTPYACLSIYGLETSLQDTVCSWKHPAAYYVGEARKLGFNTIRIPIAIQYIVEGRLDVLDKLVFACVQSNMSFLLDFHRVTNARQEESWDIGIKEYGLIHSREELRDIMMSVITRYEPTPQFIGMNSWNEYVGTNVTYKTEWDRFVFDKIEATFPGRFVYFPTGMFWGGCLIGYSLEDVTYADRVIYAVHKYHFSGTGDRDDWERSFGTLFPPSKLFIEEYGFRDPQDLKWGREFVGYLKEKGIRNHCFWTVAHSGDTGGLWEDNCETLNLNKLEIIQSILLPN
jgi:hypothetical protein